MSTKEEKVRRCPFVRFDDRVRCNRGLAHNGEHMPRDGIEEPIIWVYRP